MQRMLSKKKAGFTLLELMIVVAILGILAAVAIPAFMTYIRRSKTGEATTNVEKLFTASATYFANDRATGAAVNSPVVSNCGVPAIPANPVGTAPDADKHTIDATVWDPTDNSHPTTAIGFVINDPLYYVYSSTGGAGCGLAAAGNLYTFYAVGDLDGDNDNSNFTQAVDIIASGGSWDLAKAGAFYVQNELE